MKKIGWISLLFLPLMLQAQMESEEPEKAPDGAVTFGVMGHTFGFGMSTEFFVYNDKWDFFSQISFTSYRHPKETKIESFYKDQGGKKYIFDKKNGVLMIAPVIGVSRSVIPRTSSNKMGIRVLGGVGPALALVKPYYIEVAVPIPGTQQATKKTVKYDGSLYTYSDIVGEADHFLGFSDMKLNPGIRVTTGMQMDFSGVNQFLRYIEFDLYADYFFKELEIFDLRENPSFFIGGSVSLYVGNTF